MRQAKGDQGGRAAMDRATRRLLDKVRRAVRSRELWKAGERILLGCSGGLDSTAAAAVLAELRPSLGHELALIHIDHGLRAEAAAEGDRVERLGARLGVSVLRRRLQLADGANLQGRARTARYRALHDASVDCAATGIATAHHADDQAETLLMRAARGASLAALAGIRWRSGAVVRPLLAATRAELQAYVRVAGLSWTDDPSNRDRRFARNALRHDAMPALDAAIPGAAAGLARTAGHLGDHAATLHHWLGVVLDDIGHIDDGVLRFPARLLRRCPSSALGAWLHDAAARLGVAAPSQRALQQICAFVASGPGDGIPCEVAGMRLTFDGDEALLARADIARGLCAD